ncbi:hypothetical protein LguiA_014399 [Lonicera macranthoides]
MEDDYCTDCRRETEVVYDHKSGDTVCSECGLVLEARSIDEHSEWRTFADSTDDRDPTRVGSPVNPLLSHGGLSTIISRDNGGGGKGEAFLNRLQCRGTDPDRALVEAFGTIATMSDRLSLVATIKDRASEMYKRLEDHKCTKGRNGDALAAACIYIACRKEGKPRTVKEICTIANGVTKKEIGKAKDLIVRQLTDEMGPSMEMGTIHAEDYLRRFCSNLGMGNKEVKAVQEAVQKSKERSPISVAAAVIYMITQLSNTKKPLKDISVSTLVAENTIKNAYKDIYPHASRIVPDWFSRGNDLNKLLRA